MRARITLAFVATLILALFVASVASLFLVRHASSVNAQRAVLNQALEIKKHPTLATIPGVLQLVHSIAGLKSESVIVINANGLLASRPPPNLPSDKVRPDMLVKGIVVSGVQNHVAFAAVPLFTTDAGTKTPSRTVALVLESDVNFSVANVLYFALAGLVSLVVAAGVSIEISRRISRHVRAAAVAARKIAAGDFSARMNVPGHGYHELVELQDSLNLMAHDLERAREAERDFLLSISHELRTPLTSIRGYAEAIAEGAIAVPSEAAVVVVTESERLERLIEDLLSMARLSAHQFTFRVRRCDLTRTAVSAADSLRFAFEQSGVALQIIAPDRGLIGETDEDRLSQIISNLVENALKYATKVVDIVIEHGRGDELLVAVGDDGPGIEIHDQSRVFDRLFRVDHYRGRKVGTGLGLAIVAEFTQALGGSISVVSPRSDGKGTVMRLRLPKDVPSRIPL